MREGDSFGCPLLNVASECVIQNSDIQANGGICYKYIQIFSDIVIIGILKICGRSILSLDMTGKEMGNIIKEGKNAYVIIDNRKAYKRNGTQIGNFKFGKN